MKKIKTLKSEDAYGHEILAYYKDECCVLEIVERDDGYIEATNPKIYFSDYEEWPSVEQKAMESVKGRVLDIGCGAGRHSLYLQEKGCNVLGIDASPLAAKVSRLRGLKKVRLMSVEEIDFKAGSFDTVIMMGNNFGLLGSFKKAQRLLRRFHRMTSKNALIIADTRDPYKTENPFHLQYHRLNKRRGRMGGQLKIKVRFRKYATPWFDYLIVSREEIKEILKGTEWRVREFIDGDGPEYVAIIEKTNQPLH